VSTQRNDDGNTALIWASWCGHTKYVQLLINSGADLNTQNKYGNTALMVASQRGHTECVQLLIDAENAINKN
jgi:ankyrin repeat protein